MAARRKSAKKTATLSSPEERPETSAPGTGTQPARQATAVMRRKLFALYYVGVAKANATLAAEMAGFSKRSAYELGSRLCAEPDVQRMIAEARASILVKAEAVAVVDKARVLRELERIALLDPADIFSPVDGRALAVRDMPEDARRALRSVKVKRLRSRDSDDEEIEEVVEFTFWSKPDTLINLGKELGCTFPNRHELTGAGGAPIATTEVELTEDERRARVAALFAGLLTT